MALLWPHSKNIFIKLLKLDQEKKGLQVNSCRSEGQFNISLRISENYYRETSRNMFKEILRVFGELAELLQQLDIRNWNTNEIKCTYLLQKLIKIMHFQNSAKLMNSNAKKKGRTRWWTCGQRNRNAFL